MVGERVGYLIVLRWSTDHKMFECACVGSGRYCRRVSLNSEKDLLSGDATSCGCLLIGADRTTLPVLGS